MFFKDSPNPNTRNIKYSQIISKAFKLGFLRKLSSIILRPKFSLFLKQFLKTAVLKDKFYIFSTPG
jgi:hypothetical protein